MLPAPPSACAHGAACSNAPAPSPVLRIVVGDKDRTKRMAVDRLVSQRPVPFLTTITENASPHIYLSKTTVWRGAGLCHQELNPGNMSSAVMPGCLTTGIAMALPSHSSMQLRPVSSSRSRALSDRPKGRRRPGPIREPVGNLLELTCIQLQSTALFTK